MTIYDILGRHLRDARKAVGVGVDRFDKPADLGTIKVENGKVLKKPRKVVAEPTLQPEPTPEETRGKKIKTCTVYPEHVYSNLNGQQNGVQMIRCKCGSRRAGTAEEVNAIRQRNRGSKPIPRSKAECRALNHEPDGWRLNGHDAFGRQILRCRHCHACETQMEGIAA